MGSLQCYVTHEKRLISLVEWGAARLHRTPSVCGKYVWILELILCH